MIYLFTDFGSSDIYVGQVKARLAVDAPSVPVIDLLHAAQAFDIASSAHLLHALLMQLPLQRGDVVMAVVDPGVGTVRRPVAIDVDGVWLVGPDNGLFSVHLARRQTGRVCEILWQPEPLSRTFHGRDLFAPIAARLATKPHSPGMLQEVGALQVQLDAGPMPRILHIDHYGNAMTGLEASQYAETAQLQVHAHSLSHARTYAEVSAEQAFWYANSLGLVEIAVNQGSAAERLKLHVGDAVSWLGGQELPETSAIRPT